MGYSRRGITDLGVSLVPSSQHEKPEVHVYSIDGNLLGVLQRTAFITDDGRRVVRLMGKERQLRRKKGSDSAIVLSLDDAKKFSSMKQTKKAVKSENLRMRLRDLKKMLCEELVESDEPEKESGDSLDSQVDKYFGEYEKDSKPAKTEAFNFKMSARRILNEEDEDSKVPADSSGGKLTESDIEIETFANDVVRLIENYDSLLEVRNTIVRRAKNFLSSTYDEQVVQKFEDVLRDEHGIEDGKSQEDISDEEFPAPAADRAGGGGPGGTAA